MLFALPDDNTLYDALLARDPRLDGQAFVGVTSTGIFCRLTCPARKPLRKNCRFFATAAECVEAGFRPCKRCHPLPDGDPLIADLLARLEAEPERRWSEADLTALGHDPSTVRRVFKRALGTTFLEIARQRRIALGLTTLASGEKVIGAQIDAGFDSPSAFREAFAGYLGLPPGAFKPDAILHADWIETPLGPMVAVADARALHLLEFVGRKALPAELRILHAAARGRIGFGRPAPIEQAARDLDAYFTGRSARFSTPLAPGGTPFEQTVWTALQNIPPGETTSYGALAQTIGHPTAARAVARANGKNRIALLIPCHRVIGADGSLTGYGGGLWRKERLIAIERQFRKAPS